MLVFEVWYPQRRVLVRGSSELKWPPHPARFFAALVASWGTRGRDPAEEEALRWLEAQGPPTIWAPELRSVTQWRTYVPPNEFIENAEKRKKKPRPLQSRLCQAANLEEDRVYFVWETEPPEGMREPLASLGAGVVYLGNSYNQVVVSLLNELPRLSPPEEDGHGYVLWKPVSEITERLERHLRVPYPGFFDALERNFRRGIRDLPARFVPYAREGESKWFNPWRVAFVWRVQPALPLAWAQALTARARIALLSKAGDDAPPELTGHDPGGGPLRAPHYALIPLPNVGHPHADGRILGLALLEPREIRPGIQAKVLAWAMALREILLPGGLPLSLQRASMETRPIWTLNPLRWQRRGRRWATVTPVIFDRHPKRGADTLEVLKLSCRYAGLPEPCCGGIELGSPIRGVPESRSFALREDWDKGTPIRSYVAHVWLEFKEEMEGPILLGRGRYLGIGLMVPWREGNP